MNIRNTLSVVAALALAALGSAQVRHRTVVVHRRHGVTVIRRGPVRIYRPRHRAVIVRHSPYRHRTVIVTPRHHH